MKELPTIRCVKIKSLHRTPLYAPIPNTNYSPENLRKSGGGSIAAEPFRDQEKILSVFLVLDINPTVSRSTNASFIPSPQGSASPTLSRAVNTVMKGT